MTFGQIVQQVMDRLNLVSSDARTRIKTEVNLRYREVATAVNLDRARRGTVQFTTASGSSYAVASGSVAKVLSVYDPTILMNVLGESTVEQLINMDAATLVKGTPYLYAVNNVQNNLVRLRLFPQPQQENTLYADAILAGTDLVEDSDEPLLPVDFHDILVLGACADELLKMDKQRIAQQSMEQRFEKRLSELRYFIVKSAYLHTYQNDSYAKWGLDAKVWPWTNIAVG